jgi:peptidoglycan-associated lipoprotein
MRQLALATLVAIALVGCSTTPSPEAPIDDKGTAGAADGSGASTAGAGSGGVGGTNVPSTTVGGGTGSAGNPLRDPSNILSKRSVFFEFDSFAVSDQYRPLVEAHARYLAANQGARATIQGNTDERGSREYNIALGQRRADSIKRMMILVGARDNQVETVSYGEEKPRNPGHDENAWSENRRGDILHAGE